MFEFLIQSRRRRQAKRDRNRTLLLRRRFNAEALEQRLFLSGTNTDGADATDFADEGGLIELSATDVPNSAPQVVIDWASVDSGSGPATIFFYSAQGNEGSDTNFLQSHGTGSAVVGRSLQLTNMGDLGVVIRASSVAADDTPSLLTFVVSSAETDASADVALRLAEHAYYFLNSDSFSAAGASFPISVTDTAPVIINTVPNIDSIGVSLPDFDIEFDFTVSEGKYDDPFADDTDTFPLEATNPLPRRLPAQFLPEFSTFAANPESANAPAEQEGMIDVSTVLDGDSSARTPNVFLAATLDGGDGQRPVADAKFGSPVLRAPHFVANVPTPRPPAAYELCGTRGRSQAFELATLGPADSHRAGSRQPIVPATFDLSAVQDRPAGSFSDVEVLAMSASHAARPARQASVERLQFDDATLAGLPLTAVDAAFKQIGSADNSWFAYVDNKQAIPLFVALAAATGFLVVRPAWGVPDGRDRLIPKPRPLYGGAV